MEARVGIAVFVLNAEGKFILGKRKGSHGANTWGLPGGHLEFGESFETCGERELLEETGLKVQNLQFLTANNNVFRDVTPNKHYVTIFMGGVCEEGAEPQIMEPEKCTAWDWVSWDEMVADAKIMVSGEGTPSKELFLPLVELLLQRPAFSISRELVEN
ncbi:hypothetical protein N7532_009014 [Penicillium argentinense]|uniref:Nudix hydrolase domain-containing protein n=1 Tax=Penicillium argentinense TaxID=1131581 RepID=A0A9W9K2F6_9EURO|nr:uncharacterized protein N7532_009014 [Penicillium argentinense]KAJ5090330.1 hypothetical protein N7532_009014 [Penicillium argentinense]